MWLWLEDRCHNIRLYLFIFMWAIVSAAVIMLSKYIFNVNNCEAGKVQAVISNDCAISEDTVIKYSEDSSSLISDIVSKITYQNEVIIPEMILDAIGSYADDVSTYSEGVMSKLGLHSAYVYDYCADPYYGGYSVHIMFDDVRYQCVWINPVNRNCLLLYDCDLTNPVYRRLFD